MPMNLINLDMIPIWLLFHYKKDWVSFPDFFGSNLNWDIDFLSFVDARAVVRNLKLKTLKDYQKWWKENNPNNIPYNPMQYYTQEWISSNDWLGNGKRDIYRKNKMNFEDARRFARSLQLKSYTAWRIYIKSGKCPKNIPANPRYYIEFTTMGDWLGTNIIATQNRKFLEFEKAREFIRGLKLKTCKEWNMYRKSGKLPIDIPTNPNRTYKEFISFSDWLGVTTIAAYNKKYKTFKNAKIFVKKLKLNTLEDWKRYCKSGNKPLDIPVAPNHVYKNKGWCGIGDWLGTNSIATQNRKYLNFIDTKFFVKPLNLKSKIEWILYCKFKKPIFIHCAPYKKYKNEWKGWKDFLGY